MPRANHNRFNEAGGAKAPGKWAAPPALTLRLFNVPAYSDLTAIFRGRALAALGT